MGFEHVAILGTNVTSASIALGLKALAEAPAITGFDMMPARAELAKSNGAFDRVQRQLDRAVREADLVVVAVPLAYVRDTFRTIAPALRQGCLVTDVAPLKAPVMAWADELLPQSVRFAGGHMVINPARVPKPPEELSDASADLLRGALYCFTIPIGPTESLIDELTELAAALGAQPFFMDATEHDGMQAGAEGLPSLLTVALLLATVDTPGWHEMRKFAAQRFAAATETVDADFEAYPSIHHNRANIVLRLNGLLAKLIRLREILTQGDVEQLEATFSKAAQARASWIQERDRGLWGVETVAPMDEVPTSGEQVGRLFFGDRVIQRLRKRPDSPKQP